MARMPGERPLPPVHRRLPLWGKPGFATVRLRGFAERVLPIRVYWRGGRADCRGLFVSVRGDNEKGRREENVLSPWGKRVSSLPFFR